VKPALGSVYTGMGLDGKPHQGTLVAMLRGMDCAWGKAAAPPVWAVLESPAGQFAVDRASLRKENDT